MEYIPDVVRINRCIGFWREREIAFCGMIHSHPPGNEALSVEDEAYIGRIFDVMPPSVEQLYFPILIPKKEMIPFTAVRSDNGVIIQRSQIEIVGGR